MVGMVDMDMVGMAVDMEVMGKSPPCISADCFVWLDYV